MLLRTLGSLELEGADFRRPKPLLLLAYLALEGPHERGYLAELFFGGSKKARGNLSVALSRLRQTDPDVIEADEAKVWTTIETDAQQFLTALEKGDLEGLKYYQGRFLGGVDSSKLGTELEEWLYGTREFLASQAQLTQVKRAEKEAAKGQYKEAADVAAHAYQLRDTTPDPDMLRRIHTLLLAGNSLYVKELKGELGPFHLNLCQSPEEARDQLREVLGVTQSTIPNNLPVRGTSFVGRDLELAEISQLLAEHRLLTLLGSGGVGKSRLALQVAQQRLSEAQFTDGVYFVALDALTSAEAFPSSLATALGLSLQGGEDALAQITHYLGEKRILLVLDNFEHIIEAARLVSYLLYTCPNLSVLVTSRERLNLEEEWRFELGGLAYPKDPQLSFEEAKHFDSVQLFWQRASQAKPDFELDVDDLDAVIRICTLVEGLPLALELTATWVRVMRCGELAEALGQNLDLLTTPNRDVPDKHRSIRASFEHSWQRLSAKEQAVLRRLAVFRGGFRREAASEVAGATLPVLASLVDKSLLRVSATGRYDRHPLLYQCTQEKLSEQPETKRQTQNTHAQYFLEVAEEGAACLKGKEQGDWLKRLEAEHDNVRTALGYLLAEQDAEAGLRLAIAASQYWSKSGRYEEGYLLLMDVLRFHDADKALRAQAFMRAGTLKFQQREMDEAWSLFEAGLKLSRELGDKRGLSAGLNNLGNLAAGWGDYERARTLLEESLKLRRDIDLKGAMAWSLFHLSGVERAEGFTEKARQMLAEALELLCREGDISSTAWVLDGFGQLEQSTGHFEAAQAYFEQALRLRHDINDSEGKRVSHANLGLLARDQQKCERAKQHFLESLRWSRELKINREIAWSLFQLGELALAGADRGEAEAYFKESIKLRQELNDSKGVIEILAVYARDAAKHNDFQRAAILWGVLEKHGAAEKEVSSYGAEEVRRNLAEDTFKRAYQKGSGMSVEQAITYAFDEVVARA